MDIFSIFSLFGGLALFLYGMNVMSSGLEKMAGGRLEHTLRKMTSNIFLALVLGAGVTIAIQSSSALTVMLVGLVNSGLMQFGQTLGALMGSNIGTTFTAWILSLSGIKSDNVFMNLLKPENFSMIFAVIGIVLILISKSEKRKSIGNILIGFAVLMFGMTVMSNSMEPLSNSPEFAAVLGAFRNPLVALLVATVFTGLIQSSAASIGILMALCATQGITYGMAIPIIMGQNIGTCATALLSSIGVNRNAKKVAVAHVFIKVAGTVICLVPFLILNSIFNFGFYDKPVTPVAIAAIHSIFNIVTTAVLMPFNKKIESLCNRILPGQKELTGGPKLDERLMKMPALATAAAFDATVEMAKLSCRSLRKSLDLLDSFSEKTAAEISKTEERIDRYEDELGTYIVHLSREDMQQTESQQIAKILHTINDFERIGDHACNFVKTAREIHDKELSFSPEAKKELAVINSAILKIVDMTVKAFAKNDMSQAVQVEPLEQVVDKLIYIIKNRHVQRLQNESCTIEMGFVLHDILNNYERVSDHCSNVAAAVIETERGSFQTHEYLHAFKEERGGAFERYYQEFDKQFSI